MGPSLPPGQDDFGFSPTPESAEKAKAAAARATGKPPEPPKEEPAAPVEGADAGADPTQGAGETPATEPTAAQPPASGDGAGATGGETGQSPKEIATAKLLEKYGVKTAGPGGFDLGTMPAAERDQVQRVLNDNFDRDADGTLRLKPAAAARVLQAQRGGQQQPAVPPVPVDERAIWQKARETERKYLESFLAPEDVDEALRSSASQERIKQSAQGELEKARESHRAEQGKAYALEYGKAQATVKAFFDAHPDAKEGGKLHDQVDSWFEGIPEPVLVGLINAGYIPLDRIYEAEATKANFSRAISEAFEEGQKNPTAELRSGGAPAGDTRGRPAGSSGKSPAFKSDAEFKNSLLRAGQLQSFESLLKD